MLGLFRTKKRKTDRAKILLVDDNPDLVEIVLHMLVGRGWEVITSANGRDALEKTANEKPDLILLDINMPVMNGHEMLNRLRKDRGLGGTPVVMCTMSDHIRDVTKAASQSVCGYVTKPVDRTALTTMIAEALEKRDSHRFKRAAS